MNEKHGTLTTLLWLDIGWDDDYLRWDPELYDGLSRVELPPRYFKRDKNLEKKICILKLHLDS